MLTSRPLIKTAGILLFAALSVLLAACQLHDSTEITSKIDKDMSAMPSVIYIQAAIGSFNHQAVNQLYKQKDRERIHYAFSGTPLKTFENAWNNDAEAFVALRNDLVPGNLIKATVDALKEYRVVEVTAAVSLPIQMCLFRTRDAIKQNQPLNMISSHPAALAQISKWKAGKNLEEVEEPNGTSVAARNLAEGKLPIQGGAVGSCMLDELYPELVVVESGIQDAAENHTLFGRLRVEKRNNPVSEAQAKADLQQVIIRAKSMVFLNP